MNTTSTYSPKYTPDRRFSIGPDLNSPVSFRPQRRGFNTPSSIDNYRKYQAAKTSAPTIRAVGPDLDSAVQSSVAIGAAAIPFAPVIAPAVAAAGVGYGVYKLGKSFNLW